MFSFDIEILALWSKVVGIRTRAEIVEYFERTKGFYYAASDLLVILPKVVFRILSNSS